MSFDASDPTSARTQNDHTFFSILKSPNPEEQLDACINQAAMRDAFKTFESNHPGLIWSSPLLHRASVKVKEIDYSGNFAMRGLSGLAAKIYSSTIGHFREQTKNLEKAILGGAESLSYYLSSHILSESDLDLINVYINEGVISLDVEPYPLVKFPGLIPQLLSRETTSAHWLEKLTKDNPEYLETVLSFAQLSQLENPERKNAAHLILKRLEHLHTFSPKLAMQLISQRTADGNYFLTTPELKDSVFSWVYWLEESNPELMHKVLGILSRAYPQEVELVLKTRNKNESSLLLLQKNPLMLFETIEASLQFPEYLPILFKVLHEFSPDTFSKLFTQNFLDRALAFQFREIEQTELVIGNIAAVDPNTVALLLLQRDKNGTYYIDLSPNFVPLFLSIMEKTESDEIRTLATQMLTAEDKYGNTYFHELTQSDNIEKCLTLADSLGIDLNKLANKYGFTPFNYAGFNEEWLKAEKPDLTPIPTLTEEEYLTRALKLQEKVLSEWKSFNFGYSPDQLKPHYLDVDGKHNAKDSQGSFLPIPQEEIDALNKTVEEALEEMLKRIVNKTPFLMTPKAENLPGLHRWYTGLLVDLETIVQSMEGRDADYRAGTLISTARTQISGRCGTAYKREAKLQARLCMPEREGLSIDQLIYETANTALLTVIERIVSTKYGGDVHYLQQFLCAAGLETEQDPVPSITLEEARSILMKPLYFTQFLTEFNEDNYSVDLPSYLKSQTPDDFDDGYLEPISEARAREQIILGQTRRDLAESFPGDSLNTAMNVLLSIKGPSLEEAVRSEAFQSTGNLVQAACATALEQVLKQLTQFNIPTDVIPTLPDEISDANLDAYETDFKKIIRQSVVPPNPNTIRIAYNAVTRLKETLQTASKFHNDMKGNGYNDPKTYIAMIEAKERIENGLQKIAEDIEEAQPESSPANLSYSPRRGGLPSQTFDNSRRLEYFKDTIGSELLTVVKTLEIIGALNYIAITFSEEEETP